MLAIGAAGCAGGSRAGSDQPGVEAPQNNAGAAERASIATSSEKDIQSALRANDVDDPDRWAKLVFESRPYPPGPEGERRIRDVLTSHGAEPDVVDGVARTVSP